MASTNTLRRTFANSGATRNSMRSETEEGEMRRGGLVSSEQQEDENHQSSEPAAIKQKKVEMAKGRTQSGDPVT